MRKRRLHRERDPATLCIKEIHSYYLSFKNRVGTGYRGFIKFLFIDQYVFLEGRTLV